MRFEKRNKKDSHSRQLLSKESKSLLPLLPLLLFSLLLRWSWSWPLFSPVARFFFGPQKSLEFQTFRHCWNNISFPHFSFFLFHSLIFIIYIYIYIYILWEWESVFSLSSSPHYPRLSFSLSLSIYLSISPSIEQSLWWTFHAAKNKNKTSIKVKSLRHTQAQHIDTRQNLPAPPH